MEAYMLNDLIKYKTIQDLEQEIKGHKCINVIPLEEIFPKIFKRNVVDKTRDKELKKYTDNVLKELSELGIPLNMYIPRRALYDKILARPDAVKMAQIQTADPTRMTLDLDKYRKALEYGIKYSDTLKTKFTKVLSDYAVMCIKCDDLQKIIIKGE